MNVGEIDIHRMDVYGINTRGMEVGRVGADEETQVEVISNKVNLVFFTVFQICFMRVVVYPSSMDDVVCCSVFCWL
ncbi:hypothetical protein V4B17_05895 [Bartonella sp. B23]